MRRQAAQFSPRLAEGSTELLRAFRMREVRRLCANGRQTAIVTTRTDRPIEVVAYRTFERWTHENFFRYMRQHVAQDALVTYAVEPADPERSIPNPQRTALDKALTASRAALKELEQTYGQQARTNPEAERPTMRGFKIAQAELIHRITALDATCRRLQARLAALPKRVPVKTVLEEAEIVKLAPEAKHLTDTIKIVAYRAETEDDGRALIREILPMSADILPQADDHRLLVRLLSLGHPRSNDALANLYEMLNALEIHYPGTDLQLVYQAPGLA